MKRGGESECPHQGCPPVETRLPYDELGHEVNGNLLLVRVAKVAGKIRPVQGFGGDDGPSVRADCEDGRGNKCRAGCARLRVIPNKAPPAKRPDEEMLLLRATRQILTGDEMRNSLEIELRTPRNYEPLGAPLPDEPSEQDKPAARQK